LGPATYSPFNEFTYVATDLGTTNCGSFTYSVTIALGSATNILQDFYLDAGTTGFVVWSTNANQAGTFSATLTGALTSYPN
jgi:hypothetical protein